MLDLYFFMGYFNFIITREKPDMRFIKSLNYAWQGIVHCIRSEKNFQIQLVVASITFLGGILFDLKNNEWLMILFCSALVLSLELINTSIEQLSNIVSESIHPLIKLVKDVAAGAVLLASIVSFAMGCIIFLPKIELLIKSFK